MDFSIISQLRTKKYWWMDVVFYLAISVLVATVFCYVIFLVKNDSQRKEIEEKTSALATVGTAQQKEQEQSVINYQKKILDFSGLIKNHYFASNVLAFMNAQTLPNVWFSQFSMDEKNSSVQLSGEASDVEAFSKQVAIFETNKYVKSIGTLSSSLGESSRIQFNLNLSLDKSIFNYLADISFVSAANNSVTQSSTQTTTDSSSANNSTQNTTTGTNNTNTTNKEVASTTGTKITGNTSSSAASGSTTASGSAETKETTTGTGNLTTNTSETAQQTTEAVVKSSEKKITSFVLLLNPEVAGLIDETNYEITLNVPDGTDVKNLIPSIALSKGAKVLPVSDISQDFSSPLTYMVTAEDGSIQNYIVKVNVSPAIANKNISQSNIIMIILIVFGALVIIAIGVFIIQKRKNSTKVKV
jgi:hypothetical protein